MASTTGVDLPVRPALRGVLHRYAAVAFATGFVVLIASAGGGHVRPWLAVHGTSVTAMLTVSAVYHSGRLSEAAEGTFRRIDHSTILLAIAGSYTGVVGPTVEGESRAWLLGAVWVLAVIGMVIRMLWLDAPYPVVAAVYLAVGWVAALDLDVLIGALTAGELGLVVAGGVLYTLGAVVYALHAPNPWPRTFGYHEVFHALVVLAAAAHLLAVSLIAGRVG